MKKVIDFELFNDYILADTEDGVSNILDRSEFESFVDRKNGRDVCPFIETPGDEARTMDWAEYYEHPAAPEDLAEFLEVKETTYSFLANIDGITATFKA